MNASAENKEITTLDYPRYGESMFRLDKGVMDEHGRLCLDSNDQAIDRPHFHAEPFFFELVAQIGAEGSSSILR